MLLAESATLPPFEEPFVSLVGDPAELEPEDRLSFAGPLIGLLPGADAVGPLPAAPPPPLELPAGLKPEDGPLDDASFGILPLGVPAWGPVALGADAVPALLPSPAVFDAWLVSLGREAART